MKTPVLEYLRNAGPDHRGRFQADVLTWENFYLEKGHDYIQWVFPSDIPSEHFEGALVLTKEEMAVMASDTVIRQNMEVALIRFLDFYSDPQWISPYNHNFKRLTRILRCLWICGMKDEYNRLQEFLKVTFANNVKVIGSTTVQYWMTANKDL